MLADELGVSVRTIYRDVASLQLQGARIDGEPGLGYMLRPGFMLPPLMFSEEELEALMLGSRWVAQNTDRRLAVAARNVVGKVAAVLPQDLRDSLEASGLLVGPANQLQAEVDLGDIRAAIRAEHKVCIDYQDSNLDVSTRTIWPIALAFFERARIVAAWCELRQDFRHFRTDRITALHGLGERYPKRRSVLLYEWREQTGIPEPQQ